MAFSVALILLVLGVQPRDPAVAADRLVHGRRLTVTPDPTDPSERQVVAVARDPESAEPLTGDPTLTIGRGGAVLELVARL